MEGLAHLMLCNAVQGDCAHGHQHGEQQARAAGSHALLERGTAAADSQVAVTPFPVPAGLSFMM